MKINSNLFWAWLPQYNKGLHIGEFFPRFDKEFSDWLNDYEDDEN